MPVANFVARALELKTRPLDRPDDHGPLLNVLAWFLAVCNVITILGRLASKALYSKSLGLDDGLITMSLAMSIGQVIAFSFAVANGVGKSIHVLNVQEILEFSKALYVSNILWHCSQVFSKLSIITFLRSLSPTQVNLKSTTILFGITIVWGVTALLILTFKCDMPEPWSIIGNKCLDVHYIWGFTNTMNVFIDVLLIGLPFAILWNLNIPPKRKTIVLCFFGTRVFTIAAIIFQITQINQMKEADDPKSDVPFDTWLVHIAMSLAQTLDVVTACVPFMKPVVDGLESGMIRNDGILRRTTSQTAQRGNIIVQSTRKRITEGYQEGRWVSVGRRGSGSGSGSSMWAMNHERHVHEMGPIHSHGTSNSVITNNTVSGEERISQEIDWGSIQNVPGQGNVSRQE